MVGSSESLLAFILRQLTISVLQYCSLDGSKLDRLLSELVLVLWQALFVCENALGVSMDSPAGGTDPGVE